jgi:hypothetical protein
MGGRRSGLLRHRAALASAVGLLGAIVLAGCGIPEPDQWTYHDHGLLRPTDDLAAIGAAWRAAADDGDVRSNIPSDAACYFHLERGDVQDDVVCGPIRRADQQETHWQRAAITSFYQEGGEVSVALGGDGTFEDVDPQEAGDLRAADGSAPDLDASADAPSGTELGAGESAEVEPRLVEADDHAAYGGCLLTSSTLCTVDSSGDGGRRILQLGGREVLVVFQDLADSGYGSEPYDPAAGTHLVAVTIVNTRLEGGTSLGDEQADRDGGDRDDAAQGDGGQGGSGTGAQWGRGGADLADYLPQGTDGALSGAQDGPLTATATVGDAPAQDLGTLPETSVTAEQVLERVDADPPSAQGQAPEGTSVHLIAVPDGEDVVVTIGDGTYDATFDSGSAETSTTVPAKQRDLFTIAEPRSGSLPSSLSLGIEGDLEIGGRTSGGDVPITATATLSYIGSSGEATPWVAGDDGAPAPVPFTPDSGRRAKYSPSLQISDPVLEVDGTDVPLSASAEDGAAAASGTVPAGTADGARDLRVHATVELHLTLAEEQEVDLPADQPREVTLTQELEEPSPVFGSLGCAAVYGW